LSRVKNLGSLRAQIGATASRSSITPGDLAGRPFCSFAQDPYGSAGKPIASVLTGVAAGRPGIEGRAGVASPGIVGRVTLACREPRDFIVFRTDRRPLRDPRLHL
jgi:hypothetical protein